MNFLGFRIVRLATRAVLALAAIGCAVPAYHYAEVAALRANAPLEATKIAPRDAKALANALGGQFDKNPQFRPSAGAVSDIRTALVSQPLEPKLLGILGLAYEATGDTKQAAEVMRVANRASRHDSVSGLYLIENASTSGDVKATLKHYNTVLSTQPDLNAALLPILSSAIAYAEVRAELRPYLQTGAKWAPLFLTVAAEKSSSTDLQALLLPLPKALLNEKNASILATILHQMAVKGDRKGALRFASAAIPRLSAAALSDLSVYPATLDKRLGLFAWTFPFNDGIEVEIAGGRSLEINANPLSRGVAAVRDLLLEGGRYQLVQRLEYSSSAARIDARWSADCINPSGSVRFWDQRLPTSDGNGLYVSDLAVPQNCKVVRMTLFAEGPDGQIPSTMVIHDLYLAKEN